MDNNIIIEELLKIFGDIKKVNILKLKKNNINLFNEIVKKTNYITECKRFTQRIYHIMQTLHSVPICKMCKTPTTFINLINGYSTYCSRACCNQDPEIIKKVTKANIETYKQKKDDIREKIKKTCLEKYGVEDPNQLTQIKEKIKTTKIKNNINEKECLEKRRQTCFEKYGVYDFVTSQEFKTKVKKTIETKYGGVHPLQTQCVKDKIKKTIIEKYGVDNIFKYDQIKENISTDSKNKFISSLDNKLQILKFDLLDDQYINNKYEHTWKCLVCNNIFKKPWRDMCRGYTCSYCYPRINTSKEEKELKEFIESYKIEVNTNNRKMIWPKEIDLYIPSKRIAIEFNGLYWHCDERLIDPLYHLTKTNVCLSKNIRLIHIFEDEWLNKKEIVKNRILSILGLHLVEKIHARKCSIKEITVQQKDEFLEKFHIQGKDISSIRLGAFYQEKLIAVMTFSKGNISKGSKSEEGVWELNRFCSDYNFHVVGIAGKLLSHFKKNYKWKQIFSYADRRWSDGNLYYKLGFNLDHVTKPNYWYTKRYERIHRFNLRKRPDEPKDIPEWILRHSEGYKRIWDCGHYKFRMENV